MKLDDVEICENFTREEIVKKFDGIQEAAEDFEAVYKDDHQAVYGVFIAWFGHFVQIKNFPELSQKLDTRIWPEDFQIDKAGAPIACTQHCLCLAKNTKTRVALLQDRPTYQSELTDVIRDDIQ